MTAELRGDLRGRGLKVGIVVARFNQEVTSRLLEGARAALSDHGVQPRDVTVAQVPGSFEIPVVARRMADSGAFDAVVCLGAVIRGDTDHHRHIAEGAARGISSAGLDSGVPVIFGVLTTDTVEQAIERTGGSEREHVAGPRPLGKPQGDDGATGNSGYNAGMAAIEMANLLRDIDAR